MSYLDFETSVDKGRPYFLYLFDNGVTQTRLTSDPDDVSADPEATGANQTWTATKGLKHSNIKQNGNIKQATVDVTFPRSNTFAQSLRPAMAQVMNVTIWRGHHSDPDQEHRVQWKGRIVGSKSTGTTIPVSVDLALHLACPARLHRLRPGPLPACALPARLQPRRQRLQDRRDLLGDRRPDAHGGRGSA